MATFNFSFEQDIQPLSEFRKNAASFIGRLKREKRSVVLTQHGKSAAVLVDVSEYQKMIDKITLMEEILEADSQVARGEVVAHEDTKQQIRDNLAKWK